MRFLFPGGFGTDIIVTQKQIIGGRVDQQFALGNRNIEKNLWQLLSKLPKSHRFNTVTRSIQ
jgi:hypothetical protein